MRLKPDAPMSAQVILRSPETAAEAAARFAALGFDAGTLVANSFAISAPVRVFESVFGMRLRATERGGVEVAPHGGHGPSLELPLDALPPPLRRLLDTVTFTAPPDFGPTSW